MKQTRKMKRRRRRRLRKGFKVLFIATPIIVALVFIVVYGFSLKSIETSLDLNQYTTVSYTHLDVYKRQRLHNRAYRR